MLNKKSKGVGVIITNNSRSKFYLQQKDNTHPIPKLRLKYCFFGGGIKKGEDELSALKRELSEELNKEASEIIVNKSKRLFESSFIDIINNYMTFIIYESKLTKTEFYEIVSVPVLEGKGGFIAKRKDLFLLPFIIDLEHMLRKYLGMII
jgi:8-oxo-dGTP pyrophosphatase MutT (NUDIX family)